MADLIKILLVEDEPLWQEGIKALVSMEPACKVVAVCDHYEAAMAEFEEVKPDVVLLDWKIKGDRDGLAVGASLLEKAFPPERIILVTGSHPSLIPENPYGYVPKQQIGNELLTAIRGVISRM